MGDVARPQSYNGDRRNMLLRLAALERSLGHPSVDPTARTLGEGASSAADLAAVLAQNAQGQADLAADLAANADAVAAAAQSAATAAQTTASGKNTIYRQTTAPTGGTYTVGDLWFDTDDGNKPYQWSGSAWVSAQDAAITSAAAAASAAQTTANGKNKIFVQGTTPTATAVGDTWIDTSTGNTIKTWSGSAWTANPLGAAAISSVSAASISGSITSGQIASVSATVITGQLIAGQIATGAITSAKISAGAVTATEIAANAVVAGKIDAGAVTAGTIAAGAVTTTTIAANAITSAKINAGAITATEIAAGAVTAVKIATGTITANEIAAGAITAAKIDVNAMTAKNIYTAASGNRIIMGPTVYYTEPRIVFDVDGTGASANDPSIRGAATGLIIHGGTNGSASTSISMASSAGQPDRITQSASNTTSTVTAVLDASFDRLQVSGNVTVDKVLGVTGVINSVGTFNAANISTGKALRIAAATGNYELRGDAASSVRYKLDVSDVGEVAHLDPRKLLKLPVRSFRYKPDYLEATDPRAGAQLPGFLAEEVQAIYPAAADVNEDGTAENWSERFVIPAMLALIQDAHRRLTALEEGSP